MKPSGNLTLRELENDQNLLHIKSMGHYRIARGYIPSGYD